MWLLSVLGFGERILSVPGGWSVVVVCPRGLERSCCLSQGVGERMLSVLGGWREDVVCPRRLEGGFSRSVLGGWRENVVGRKLCLWVYEPCRL